MARGLRVHSLFSRGPGLPRHRSATRGLPPDSCASLLCHDQVITGSRYSVTRRELGLMVETLSSRSSDTHTSRDAAVDGQPHGVCGCPYSAVISATRHEPFS